MSEHLSIRLDLDRQQRTGVPEIVFGPGKTAEQVVSAAVGLREAGVSPVIVSRCSAEQLESLAEAFADGTVLGHTFVLDPLADRDDHVCVVTAGTADQMVATEAVATLQAFGLRVSRIDDVGVAGVHRLLAQVDALRAADALIVVAGMEGALPTAVAGLVSTPLIAVPTSTGYGSSFEGITALASMTASCAPGVSVVGIDNGLGAACVVVRWLKAGE